MSWVAHGLGGVSDLPIPLWLVLWGGAVVVVISFVALGVLWRRPLLERHEPGRALPGGLQRLLGSAALRVTLGAVSVALLVLVFLTALLGETNPNENLAPTFIYVAFWLGIVVLVVVLGNVWRVLSPWKAVADAFVWVYERTGREARPIAELPDAVGRLPAAALLFLFVSLELAYTDPASPRALALATALYSYVTFFGMAAFGRERWLERGEAFAVYFGLLARVAPFARRDDGVFVARWPFTGLAGREHVPHTIVFVAVMLGSVGFDGFSRTTSWQNLSARVEGPFVLENPRLADLAVMGTNVAGLLAFCVGVWAAYHAAVWLARRLVLAPRSLVQEFVLSLVPIALVYAVSHYFSYFLVYIQYLVPLASDPFGFGWELLPVGSFRPNIAPVSPDTIRWVQFGSLVAGHVVGLAVAHDRAVSLFRDRDVALRSQYPLLALMVVYTVGGLWLLSQG